MFNFTILTENSISDMKFTKKIIIRLSQILLLLLIVKSSYADGSINAFYKAMIAGNLDEVAGNIKQELKNSGFNILGEYHPKKDNNLLLIAFSNEKLFNITLESKNRGALASILRVGLLFDGKNNVEICFLNPTYLFYSFLKEDADKHAEELNEIQMQAMMAIISAGAFLVPFGSGSLTENELKQYRYMVRMPSFDEPVEVAEFSSFDEGVSKIRKNLQARKEGTMKVYEKISEKEQVAIWGIGLHDSRNGEMKFLPVLGENFLAAMPYEIILQGKKATILNGRYRFPLFWSHLSMRDFHKIGRTNRDIEYMMKELTK